jgi:hypothetical protein
MSGEYLRDYIQRFSQKCDELPRLANADVVSTFWDSMMCHTLIHDHRRKQPKTTKELHNISARHASGEETISAIFIQGNVGTAACAGWATPPKATVQSSRKGAKGGKKGQKH